MKVKRISPKATIPTKAHPGDLGFDLYASDVVVLRPGETVLVPIGIAIEFPDHVGGIIKDRSSMAKKGIVVSGGVIDSEYRGEIGVLMRVVSGTATSIIAGQKIAQLILVPVLPYDVEEVSDVSDSERGSAGFGSTGA